MTFFWYSSVMKFSNIQNYSNSIMVILYSCDFCEKEFNLQIKLKKHIQADHASPKELDPSDFLDEEKDFTDDKKAEYYDDLKAKYDEDKSKVEFFEKRYSFMNKEQGSSTIKKLGTNIKSENFKQKTLLNQPGEQWSIPAGSQSALRNRFISHRLCLRTPTP